MVWGVMTDRRKMLRKLMDGIGYGSRDNVLTGIQLLEDGAYTHRSSTYTFNPWNLLMESIYLFYHHIAYLPRERQRFFEIMEHNHRKGVKRMMDMYALFRELPQPLQEEFLDMVNSNPCDIGNAMNGT